MRKKISTGLAMGLFLVGMTGMANASAVTSFDFNLYDTGVDDSGALLVNGVVDSHYSLTNPDSGNLAATAAGTRHNAWLNPVSDGSQWVTPGGGSGNVAVGVWEYSLTFDLVGFDSSTASIEGMWASDNAGEIFLNGTSTNFTTGTITTTNPSSNTFDQYHKFSIDSGFIAGENTLSFHVTNAANSPNPSGLLVDFTSSQANPVPEPATMLLLGTGLVGLIGTRRRKKGQTV